MVQYIVHDIKIYDPNEDYTVEQAILRMIIQEVKKKKKNPNFV